MEDVEEVGLWGESAIVDIGEYVLFVVAIFEIGEVWWVGVVFIIDCPAVADDVFFLHVDGEAYCIGLSVGAVGHDVWVDGAI